VVKTVRGYKGVGVAAPRYALSSSLILDRMEKNSLPEVRSMRLFGVERKDNVEAVQYE